MTCFVDMVFKYLLLIFFNIILIAILEKNVLAKPLLRYFKTDINLTYSNVTSIFSKLHAFLGVGLKYASA